MNTKNNKKACPVCAGSGQLRESITCPVCHGEKEVLEDSPEKAIFDLMICNEKLLGLAILSQYKDDITNEIKSYLIPKVTFMFNEKDYLPEECAKITDYYQMILIELNAPRSVINSTKFLIPTDELLNDILALLSTEKAKEEVREWFTYRENIN